MGSLFLPHMVLSCPISAPLHMTEKIFLSHPHPLEPKEALSHPVKLYFLLIYPFNYYNFFLIKPVSLIKIYLKLQLNLFHQIKLIFSKK